MAIADIIGSGFKRKGYEVQNDPVGSLFHMLDYKRTHLWLLEIDGLFSCTMQSAERPKLNLGDSKKVKYINTYEKLQSGTPEWMPISVVVTDPITPSTSIELYEKIRDKFWNYKTGKTGYPADYKFSKPLKLKLLDGNGAIVETWLLYDAFFINDMDYNANTLSYDSNDVLKIKFTIDYNYAELYNGGDPDLNNSSFI